MLPKSWTFFKVSSTIKIRSVFAWVGSDNAAILGKLFKKLGKTLEIVGKRFQIKILGLFQTGQSPGFQRVVARLGRQQRHSLGKMLYFVDYRSMGDLFPIGPC